MGEDHVVEGATCLADPRTINMKDSEIIKEYSDNCQQNRLLDRNFADSRIAKKILVIVP